MTNKSKTKQLPIEILDPLHLALKHHHYFTEHKTQHTSLML